jgi:EpsD family peptidyl-prolyl cis-trans isomerase
VVNGDEITLAELNQEIGAGQPVGKVDKQAIQRAALQKIIDRRLVAQVARDEGIDKQPEYLARQREANELLLIQMLGQKVTRAARMPDTVAIDKYMADNPTAFGGRTVYKLDRIQFAMPRDPGSLQAIKDDHTMDAVAARLTSMGIKFDRGPGALDSAQLPPPLVARLKALPAGEPFAIPAGNGVIVAVITGSEPQPFVGADARPVALERLRVQNLQAALTERLKTARASAKIEYQQGFAPVPQSSGGPTREARKN